MPFRLDDDAIRRVMVLGAHPDDIEIGCGGTIRRLASSGPCREFHWVVFSGDGVRRTEAREGMTEFLGGTDRARLALHQFRDGYFPYQGADIKDCFESMKRDFAPDLVLTHYRDDRHQDHRFISEMTWNTFRSATILEYEIPKYDGDFGTPNLFVALDREAVQAKICSIFRSFGSQHHRDWFDEETFRGVLRLRGMESRAPDGYAEAFYCRKILV